MSFHVVAIARRVDGTVAAVAEAGTADASRLAS
jgi:hypothetical protein